MTDVSKTHKLVKGKDGKLKVVAKPAKYNLCKQLQIAKSRRETIVSPAKAQQFKRSGPGKVG